MEIIKHTDIDFLGKRKAAFGISLLLSLVGVLCVVMIATGKANLGIDFAGGASANLVFEKPVQMDKARAALDKAGIKGADLQSFTEGSKLLVRVKHVENIPTGEVVDRITGAFVTAFPDNKVSVDSSSAIGPTVGRALQTDALKAIVIALFLIIVYIGVRFEFKFGLAATVATFHDVLAVLAVFLVMDKEITLLVVTAILTVAGYSLTDTVVVFDRIRENLKLRQKDNLLDIINFSINEVLSRTVVTSLTTFLVVLALFLFGGEVLHDFSFALMIGVIVGTYSSIFVASPLLYVWRGSKGGKLIKAAMLTKQPDRVAGVQLASASPAASAAPASQPAAAPAVPGTEAEANKDKSAKAGKKSYKRGKK